MRVELLLEGKTTPRGKTRGCFFITRRLQSSPGLEFATQSEHRQTPLRRGFYLMSAIARCAFVAPVATQEIVFSGFVIMARTDAHAVEGQGKPSDAHPMDVLGRLLSITYAIHGASQ